MYLKQPFYLTVFLGQRLNTSPEELEEIIKIYFLIWQWFKARKNLQKNEITQFDYEQKLKQNLLMLKYSEGEPTDMDKVKLYENDLNALKSKALFTAILFRFNTRVVLAGMEINKLGTIMLSIKSFIDCFDEI